MYGILHPDVRTGELPAPPGHLQNQKRLTPLSGRPLVGSHNNNGGEPEYSFFDGGVPYAAGLRPGIPPRFAKKPPKASKRKGPAAFRRSPRLLLGPEQHDEEDEGVDHGQVVPATVIVALQHRIRTVDAQADELRRDLEELRLQQVEVIRKVSSATQDVRERHEVARRDTSEDVRDLKAEVARRLETAEARLREALVAQEDRSSTESGQLAEMRGALKAMRDEQRRTQESLAERELRVAEAARRAGEQAERAAQFATRDAADQVAAAMRVVDRLAQDVEAVRHRQGGLDAKVDADMAAGHQAVQRAAAAAGHADAVVAQAEAEVLDRWRGELGSVERRLSAEVARCRAEVADEQRRRERLTADVQVEHRRSTEAVQDKVDALAAQLQVVNLRVKQRRFDSFSGSRADDDDEEKMKHEDAATDVSATSTVKRRAMVVDQEQVAVLEAQFERAVAHASHEAANALAFSADRQDAAVASLKDAVDAEAARREALEQTTARTIDSAVKSLATAFQRELRRQGEVVGVLELRTRSLDETTKARIDERTAQVEEAIVVRVAEREKKLQAIRSNVGKLANELRREIFVEADKAAASGQDLEKRSIGRVANAVNTLRAERDSALASSAQALAATDSDIRGVLREALGQAAGDAAKRDAQTQLLLIAVRDDASRAVADLGRAVAEADATVAEKFDRFTVEALGRELALRVELDAAHADVDRLRRFVDAQDRQQAQEVRDQEQLFEARMELLETRIKAENELLRHDVASAATAFQLVSQRLEDRVEPRVASVELTLATLDDATGAKIADLAHRLDASEKDFKRRTADLAESAESGAAEAARRVEASVSARLVAIARQRDAERSSMNGRVATLEAGFRRTTDAWASTVHQAATALQARPLAATAASHPPSTALPGRAHLRSVFPPDEWDAHTPSASIQVVPATRTTGSSDAMRTTLSTFANFEATEATFANPDGTRSIHSLVNFFAQNNTGDDASSSDKKRREGASSASSSREE